MNAVVLLFFIALAANIVSGAEDFSPPLSDHILEIIGYQLSNLITSREDTREGSTTSNSQSINFETQHVDWCGPILCISANLTKGSITGVTEYEIVKSELNSDGQRVDIDIDIIFPKLQVDSEYYSMEGTIMDAIPLAGEGKLFFQATEFRFWTRILLQISDHPAIESFENPGFSINSILSRIEFDGKIDDVFNAMVNELLAEYLNRFNKAIASHCGALLKEFINPILK